MATGAKVALTSTARVTADGARGGSVLIGGDLRGGIDPAMKLVNAPVQRAATTTVAEGATISANGRSGNGGNVVVWSDLFTDFRGSITATGGSIGTGGAAEVSSHGLLGFRGSVDLTSKSGKTGTLLLDPYDVTISSGSDTSISNSSNTFTPTGNSSVLSVGTLQSALATANIAVTTGAGGSQNGDITVANALTWSSGNSLSLNAAGAIAINAPITAPSGSLILSAGSPLAAITATGAINVGALTISQGAWSQNTANLPALYAGQFSIGSNASFLRAAGGSGTAGSPYLLTDIYGVQGIGSSATYIGNSYKLVNDIDATSTSGWNSGAGFTPIGSTSTIGYSGTFDGANHAMVGLFINLPNTTTGVGLFGYTNGATVQNVSLLGVNVTGEGATGQFGTGALIGAAEGTSTITNVAVTGTVAATNPAGGNLGGIIGDLGPSAIFSYGASSASVTAPAGFSVVGGAIGGIEIGGTASYISATGNVTGTGAGANSVGGLAGYVGGSLSNSYASGAVSGNQRVGGLVGHLGLTGNPPASITNSYAVGSVSGSSTVGGVVGKFELGTVSGTYWDTTTSGQGTASGSGSTSGMTGVNTAAMKTQSTYSGWDFANTWYLTPGYYPILRGAVTIIGAAGGNLTISTAADSTTNFNTTSLQNMLGAGNVLVSTESGTIGVNNAVTWASGYGLRLSANSDITVASGASITASAASDLGIDTRAGKITVNTATLSTSGGNLGLSASVSGTGTGVSLQNATIAVGSGSGTINATSSQGFGVDISGTTSLSASTGSLSISATSQAPTVLFGSGIHLASSSVLSTSGAITLTGTGGTTGNGHGVVLESAASITNSGTLTLQGTTDSNVNNRFGLYLVGNNTVTAISGSVIATGTAVASGMGMSVNSGTLTLANNGAGSLNFAGTGVSNTGLNVVSGAGITTSGAVSLSGTSSSGAGLFLNGSNAITDSAGDLTVTAVSTSNVGVVVNGTGNSITNSGAGTLSLSGTSGSGNGVSFFNSATLTTSGAASLSGTSTSGTGVYLSGANTIGTTSGDLSISGTSSSYRGVQFWNANTLTNSGGGTLNVSGTTGSSNNTDAGLELNHLAALTSSGTVILSGQSTTTNGISFDATSVTASSGNLTVNGTSGSSVGTSFYLANTMTNNGAGAINVSGTSSSGPGIQLSSIGSSSISTSGAATLSGISTSGTGFDFQGSNAVTMSSGNLAINGTTSSGTAAIDTSSVGNTITNNGSGTLTLNGTGSDKLAATISSSAGDVVISDNGALTQSGGTITAGNLLLSGAGAFSLGQANLVGTLAADVGSVSFNNNQNLAIGTIQATSGITATGTATIRTSGNLTLGPAAAVSAVSPILAAAGAFINNAGANAVAATSGRWLIYSNTPGGDTFGGLDSANTAIWNATYGTLPPASVSAAGNRYLFATQPTLTFTSVNDSKTYGTNATAAVASDYSVSGFQSGTSNAYLGDNAASAFSGAPSVTSTGAAASASVAGSPYAMAVAPGSLAALSGYAFAFQSNGQLTVNPAPISVTAQGGTSSYGSSPANPGLSATGLQNGQSASVLTGLSNSFGITNTSNAGSYVLSVIGTLTNSNYTVTGTNTGSWTVNPAPVTVTALGGSSTYGSSPTNPGLSAAGLQNGQSANVLTGLSNSFGVTNTSNAGSYVLSVIGTLTNGNYTVTGTNTGSWTVNPAPVTVTALGGSSLYGSSPSNPGLSATGLQNGESASVLTGLSNSFGVTNTSSAGSYVLSVIGTLTNGNYTVTGTNTGSWTVNPAPATVIPLDGSLRGSISDGSSPSNGGRSVKAPTNGGTDVLDGINNASSYVNEGAIISAGTGRSASSYRSSPGSAARLAPAGSYPGNTAGGGVRIPGTSPTPAAINALPPAPHLADDALTNPASPGTAEQSSCADGSGGALGNSANAPIPGASQGTQLSGCGAAPKTPSLTDRLLSKFDPGAVTAAVRREFSEASRSANGPRAIVSIAVVGTSLVFTAGFVSWLLRGGALFSAFLSSMPLWRGFDPLMIVMRSRRRDEDSEQPTSEADLMFDGVRP